MSSPGNSKRREYRGLTPPLAFPPPHYTNRETRSEARPWRLLLTILQKKPRMLPVKRQEITGMETGNLCCTDGVRGCACRGHSQSDS